MRKAYQAPNMPQKNPMQIAQGNYTFGRINLLFIALFSVINIGSLTAGNHAYLLFSAVIPYWLVDTGLYICGKYPEAFYEGGYEAHTFLDNTVYLLIVGVALLLISFYVICFLFSKNNRVGWIIAALVFFVIDTVALVFLYRITSIMIDIVIRVYMLAAFGFSIRGYYDMKKLSAEEENHAPEVTTASLLTDDVQDAPIHKIKPDSTPLRPADLTVKSRVLLEGTVFGHEVVYRRVKKTNELVIDGKVYDEYIALFERAHLLTAVIDGHDIAVGCDGVSSSTLAVDGQLVKSKVRLI